MELLKSMATESDFMELIGTDKPDPRMKDVELVLRFSSFYHATYLKYQPTMKKFFNKDMEKYQNISEHEAEELRQAFKNSLQIVKSLFGKNAFKRFYQGDEFDHNGRWEQKKFNASLYDVMLGIFCDKDKNQVYSCLDSIREGLIDLMISNQSFLDSILLGTSGQYQVRNRFDLARSVVEDILSTTSKQPRCFSTNLKQELFNSSSTCAICGQNIQLLDDSHVDHIEQYWKGGKTIPENARLTHKYCNLSRSKND